MKSKLTTSPIRRIVITLPASVLKDVEWLAPLEDITRDQLITLAIKRFLKPHLEVRKLVKNSVVMRGKTYGPFDTAEEMIASLKKEVSKLRVKKRTATPRITKAISESTGNLKTGRYEA
jgi:hypothetical protein